MSKPIYEALQEQFDAGELKEFVIGQFLSELTDYNLNMLFVGAKKILEGQPIDDGGAAEQVADISALVCRIELSKSTPPKRDTEIFRQFVTVVSIFIILEYCRRQKMVEFRGLNTVTNSALRVDWMPHTIGHPLRKIVTEGCLNILTISAKVMEDKWMVEFVQMIERKLYLPRYSLSVYLSLICDENLDEMVAAAKTVLYQVKQIEEGKSPELKLDTIRLAILTNMLLLMERGQKVPDNISLGVDIAKLARFCALLIMEWLLRRDYLVFRSELFLDDNKFNVIVTERGRDYLFENLLSLDLKCFNFSIEDKK